VRLIVTPENGEGPFDYGAWEHREYPKGVWDGAPAANEFGAFDLLQNPSRGRTIRSVLITILLLLLVACTTRGA